MKLFSNATNLERYAINWQRLFVQGLFILIIGLVLVLASVLNPNAIILSARTFSWLPLCGMTLLGLGLLACIDAFIAKEQRDFFQNLQVGVLDVVVGGLIIFSVSEDLARLSLLLSAFLLVRGIVRITLSYVLWLPHIISTVLCGAVSILTGFLVYSGWPSNEGWFFAVCLSIEIAFRGWAMMMFSFWVRKQQQFVSNDA